MPTIAVRLLLACAVLLFAGTSCAPKKAPAPQPTHKKAPTRPHTQSHTQSHTHTGDPKAQQRFYDQGLQQYSKEHYHAAKEAFLQVIEINPSNSLGLKAQENVKKINQILKTLEEMENK